MTPTRLLLSLPVAVPLALALTACGGTSTPHVASLPTPASAAAGTSSTASPADARSASPAAPVENTAPGRPQFRIDDTDARRTALSNAYSQCLLDHGAERQGDLEGKAVPANGEGKPYLLVADPVPAKARAACAPKQPLPPPQLDAATNPRFHQQSLAYVACLQAGGLWVTLLTDHSLDWTYTEGHAVPENESKIEQSCLTTTFGS